MRFWFTKDELDEFVPAAAEVLKTPSPSEGALWRAVEKSGGDETVQWAASIYARGIQAIRKAYGGRVPEELRTVIRGELGISEPPPRPVLKAVPEPVEKHIPTPPADPEHRETLEETIMKSKDALDHQRLDNAAAAIRKSDTSLTASQAYALALDQHPELYEGAQRHDALQKSDERVGFVDSAEERAIEARLSKAADRIRARKGNEILTREQAIAKALAEDPELAR